jgi:NADP-dependent 3-hydroxy acid dehydrogenase YdfG
MRRAPLDGLKVLVTGGSRGVGAAIVRRLVAEGAFPIIHYSSSMSHAESLLREIGGRGVLVRGDLSEEKAAERVWAEAVKATGRIDALVNNAGMRTEIAIDADMDDWRAAWRKEFQVNLFSAMDLSALAIRHFREIGGGRIINVSSVTAHRGYSGDTIAYGATKAAPLQRDQDNRTELRGREDLQHGHRARLDQHGNGHRSSPPPMAARRPCSGVFPRDAWRAPRRSRRWWPSPSGRRRSQ